MVTDEERDALCNEAGVQEVDETHRVHRAARRRRGRNAGYQVIERWEVGELD